jgi:hypothetical protein
MQIGALFEKCSRKSFEGKELNNLTSPVFRELRPEFSPKKKKFIENYLIRKLSRQTVPHQPTAPAGRGGGRFENFEI